MFGIDRLERELIESNALLDHIAGLLEEQIRLLRLLVAGDTVTFEAEGEEGPEYEALTA